jgi:hypothetical protein
MVDTHRALRQLVQTHGAGVLSDGDHLRGVLDDYFDELAISPGEINLLVDAVRLGAVEGLARLTDGGAPPEKALDVAGTRLARDRGGADITAARWACAMLGYALGRVPEALVLGLRSADVPGVSVESAQVEAAAPTASAGAAVTQPAGRTSDPETATPVPPQRSAQSAVFLSGLVVVTIALLIGTLLLTGHGGDDDPETSSDGSTTPASEPSHPKSNRTSGPKAERSSPTVAPTASRSTPSSSASPATFQCWDGSLVERSRDCGVPSGITGAHWMFPQSASQDCVRKFPPGRVVHLECTVHLSAGERAYVKYSQWRSWATAESHYSTDTDIESSDPDWNGLRLWYVTSGEEPCCASKAALLYPYAPWSATIYAQSPAVREDLLDSLEFRPPGTLAGEPQ